jgi:uncharacterized LabA/DUF88 family protein
MVDIALTTEALSLAAEGRTEASVIMSGDGDFVPVVEAMKRLGQTVMVAAFRSTTNPERIIAADDYVDLTPHLTGAWERQREEIASENARQAAIAAKADADGKAKGKGSSQ